ncbi:MULTISPECIES: substrate-binding domain-containing protein [unclassified Solwaraspora]|uniref:sugar ABC transporter substrate-binding protein n=1 Tax=unclassified Solwaraspora TaxID=2627926 RepID=UPI00248AC8BD|nr:MULTISPECIES: substrate-binding domain-containing protein [unclassified Solwaraspora]WBB96285.1 substrate-binding domain-containing protein [Solwaraspora sp. WMMA2059]WBC19812.1 substrate-binding domain-containing protein [Solwaraspora sp. WMMA2080]WJK32595.1 substrate-binding domain-containing protein [Solwaraspora sp. WMMA2065]
MRKGILSTAAAGVLLAGGLTACGSDTGTDTGSGDTPTPKIGVILPDSASSDRWETADRRFLQEAFDAAGVNASIQNAQGDKAQFQTLADQMITDGATVLMIVNLDSGTGKAVLDKAKQQGVATIDYDRLTLGGSAEYYVSFDNEAVGQLQGEGLVKCLTDAGVEKPTIATLNGSQTDNNATLFKAGYDGVLDPLYESGEYVKGPDQWVPDWDNTQAATLFEQMLTQTGGEVDGVLAANDGLGNAAISVLKRNELNGQVPVTGQDATPQGLQNILAGDQCMTVYKAIKAEAQAAADLAVALANGERKEVAQTVTDPETNREVPSVLLTPQAIYKENVADVVNDGYVTAEELCTDEFAELCAEAGIS